MQFVLAHGFGFSDRYWDRLAPFLPGPVSFYREGWTPFNKTPLIGIGHSLGFAKLCTSGLLFHHLFGLQPFLDFCGKEPRLRLTRQRSLASLIAHVQRDAHSALALFYRNCGYEGPVPQAPNVQALLADLELLKRRFDPPTAPTTILAGRGDKIVPLRIVEADFAHLPFVTIHTTALACHAMGTQDAPEIAALIRDALP